MIENGRRAHLVIEGVFDGLAGLNGNELAFRPNHAGAKAAAVKGGILEGRPVKLVTTKDLSGPYFTARFEEFE